MSYGYINLFFKSIPNYESLENYKPEVMSRVHAADVKLIREFSESIEFSFQ